VRDDLIVAITHSLKAKPLFATHFHNVGDTTEMIAPENGLNLYTMYFTPAEGKTLEDIAGAFDIDPEPLDAPRGASVIRHGRIVADGVYWINVPGKTEEDNFDGHTKPAELDPEGELNDRDNDPAPSPSSKPNSGPSSGPSAGPSNPTVAPSTPPTVAPAVSQPPALNTVDHFRYIFGDEDGSIRPDDDITREEVAAVFYRLLTGESRRAYRKATTDFPDVADDRWSAMNVGTVQNARIVTGYPDGTFQPEQTITRAEFATIATRFDALPEDASHNFSDIGGHWAEQYIAAAAQNGWISGYPDGSFRPDQPITRAEAMTIINRVLGRSVDAEGLFAEIVPDYTDISAAHWAYYEVLEATVSHDYQRRDGDNGVENWTGRGEDINFDIN
jgi:hypothetical protein